MLKVFILLSLVVVMLVNSSIGVIEEAKDIREIQYCSSETECAAKAPSVSAKSACLYDACLKRVLYEKNASAPLPMASTTKIMSALVAIENADINKTVTVSDEAIGTEGSSIYLKSGESFKLIDLIYAMLLSSANDASVAVAIEVGGSVNGFAELMNKRARELGLKNTHFVNPHGLDDPEHYTTALELAIITAEALKNPIFKEIASSYTKEITSLEGQKRLLVNHNKLLKQIDGCIGVKTGFTKRSGRSLVGAVERDGQMLISVTINAPDDWSDHKRLIDYGYEILSYE